MLFLWIVYPLLEIVLDDYLNLWIYYSYLLIFLLHFPFLCLLGLHSSKIFWPHLPAHQLTLHLCLFCYKVHWLSFQYFYNHFLQSPKSLIFFFIKTYWWFINAISFLDSLRILIIFKSYSVCSSICFFGFNSICWGRCLSFIVLIYLKCLVFLYCVLIFPWNMYLFTAFCLQWLWEMSGKFFQAGCIRDWNKTKMTTITVSIVVGVLANAIDKKNEWSIK